MNKIYLALITLIAVPFLAVGQTVRSYSVYKLENKIGREETSRNQNATKHISIITNDRGVDTKLTASFSVINNQVKYTSAGNTSRFTTENIDTAFTANQGFSFGNNGSIKMHKLLLAAWLKAGKPAYITSALSRLPVKVTEAGKEKDPLNDGLLTVMQIDAGLNEICWVNDKGEAVFLAFCDAESDRREVIDDRYIAWFSQLNQRSNQYLIGSYMRSNSSLGKRFDIIAIIGATLIDVDKRGQLKPNTMLLLKNGEIENYAQSGLSPIDAIRAATIVPATMMSMNNQSGSIEPGKDADMLLLDANPLLSLKALDNISMIIKGRLLIEK